MRRWLKFLIWSIVISVLSYMLMKVMYIIDPITSDGGMLTSLVFMFVNSPMWVISICMFSYSMYLLSIKDPINGDENEENEENEEEEDDDEDEDEDEDENER